MRLQSISLRTFVSFHRLMLQTDCAYKDIGMNTKENQTYVVDYKQGSNAALILPGF